MKKQNLHIYLSCVLLFGMLMTDAIRSVGQLLPSTTQYMFNGLPFNPAYAGSHETLSLTAQLRAQWLGVEGSPNTQSFSAHAPFLKDNFALGMVVLHDKIGVTNETTIMPSYAYRIHFGANKILSMGLQGVMINYKSDFTSLSPAQQNDPAFSEDISKWLFNVGAGLYFYSDKYYIGFSVPSIIENDPTKDAANADLDDAKVERLYYLTAGYVFDLTHNLQFKPNMLLRASQGSPITADINANFLLSEVVGIGASYRWEESLAVVAELFLLKNLRLGYSYDIVTADINEATTGSHELMVNYRFSFSKDKIVSPRYF